MRDALRSALILSCTLFAGSPVPADDGSPRDRRPGVVVPPVPVSPPNERDTVIEHRYPDCETKNAPKEDDGKSETTEKNICQ